ncbi:DUF362 domain-containing protein [Methanoplanus sp. FWC-SCC4]|uniref:DUF362 domain-containing protein n=1 Tax=Methanochimaera problematica TaxID=2609417 RepID=A0AA97FBX6_9EURY|nr:DUF362 domain-containing protein [Methanoplanus sp. FWC-SCC4]WOF16595.1 DUF362 domain-containing protein [Methanoplanus sp. FWC-SCC4]
MAAPVNEEGINSKKKVSIVSCENYGRECTYLKVKAAIDELGGIEKFVKPGSKVLLKPNLLMGSDPDSCVITHPDVLYAAGKILKENGCDITIADSPGAGIIYNKKNLLKNYEKSGFLTVAKDLNIKLNYDTGYSYVSCPKGRVMKSFPVINPAVEADCIVSVSKLKTHMYTYLTCAQKNLFGIVPGLDKPTFHSRFQTGESFGEMITDLNTISKTALNIVDAVWGMEENGPMGGSKRYIGAILVGESGAATDVCAAKIIGIDPIRVGSISASVKRGFLKEDFSDIELTGKKPEDFFVPDYKMPSSYKNKHKNTILQNLTLKIMQKYGKIYSPVPVVIENRCISCGQCVRICPVKAASIRNGKAYFDISKCIRCYCCHEMCDSHAIGLKRGLPGKILAKILE